MPAPPLVEPPDCKRSSAERIFDLELRRISRRYEEQHGLRLEIDPSGTCCGAAGVYSLLQPETAAALGKRKAAEVLVTEAPIVASANPGCELQLRQYLATAGSGIRVAHPVEVYWEALRRARS